MMRSVYCGKSQKGEDTATMNRVNTAWSRRWRILLSVWCRVMRFDEMKCTMSPEAKIINLWEKL